jgi:N-acetylmuramoyl-L-alanine amidase
MAYKPRKVPKRKRRIAWRTLTLSALLFAVSGYIVYALLFPKPLEVESPSFTICDYNLTQTQAKLFELNYTETRVIEDYLIYGETLNLFGERYALGQTDPFTGKTVILRDLCSQNEWVYLLDRNIDGQIPLENLSEGFYEVFIVDQLVEKRLIMREQLYDVFYTVRRGGFSTRIDLVADDDLIEADTPNRPIMDQNYFFIRVLKEEATTLETIYDLTLDPSRFTPRGSGADLGRSAHGLSEHAELLRFALALRDRLEAQGLRVHLTRDETSDPIALYGDRGRLQAAYAAQSKYYINLAMNHSTNPDVRGTRVVYSSYASNRFASQVFRALSAVPGVTPFGFIQRGNIAGVVASSRFEGFDSFPVIRESGGRILGAGTLSEESRTNAFFNADATQGMQSLSIELIFISNELDAQVYERYFDTLVDQVVLGLSNYLGLRP